MTGIRPLRVLSLLAVVAYPGLVYLAVHFGRFELLTLLVLGMLAARTVSGGPTSSALSAALMMGAGLTAIAVLRQQEQLAFFYPVCVSGSLFVAFAASLWRAPSMIERFATAMGQELDEPGRRYARRLTGIWCCFFLLNGSIALLTVFTPPEWWALYNGAISYVLVGALLVGERLFRGYWLRRRSPPLQA